MFIATVEATHESEYGSARTSGQHGSDRVWCDDGVTIRSSADEAEPLWIGPDVVVVADSWQCSPKPDQNESLTDCLKAFVTAQALNPGAAIRALAGEFALVMWDRKRKQLSAVRDPLGLKTLYYRVEGRRLRVSNRLDAFESMGLTPNLDFVADFIAFHGCSVRSTIWKNVAPVPPGSMLMWHDGDCRVERYWSPDLFSPLQRLDPREAAAEFRRLFEEGILARMDSESRTWAHLSGGLDSSSVTSLAASLALSGKTSSRLGGTITMTDSCNARGEVYFAEVVANHFKLRNERIDDDWPWRDDGLAPPPTDQPSRDYPLYARDRTVASIITRDGGTTLLSGVGADQLFLMTSPPSADLLWLGNAKNSLQELYRWSLCRGESLWRTVPRHLIMPVIAPRLRSLYEEQAVRLPDWIDKQFAKRHRLRSRMACQEFSGEKRGQLYQAAVSRSLTYCAASLAAWHPLPGIEVRHPFLHLPLVEFSLRLPYQLRFRALWSKPLLRAAVQGVLPEEVRRRRTKGTPALRVTWAFQKEHRRLTQLLRTSTLADMGVIEPRKVTEAVEYLGAGRQSSDTGYLYSTLALETWLQAKVWPVQEW